MSGASQLALRPELCDRCGKCVAACSEGKLRVGAGYIYVDASACTGCHSCVEACKRGAILRRSVPTRPTAHRAGAGDAHDSAPPNTSAGSAAAGKVVVGSRAEAKSVRRAAAASEKARAKARPATTSPAADRAAASLSEGAAWTLADAAVVAAVLLATLVAKEAVLGSKAVAVMPATGRVAARAAVLGVFYIIQGAVLAFLARRRGLTLAAAFRLRAKAVVTRDALVSAGLVVALLVATRALSTAWGAISQGLGWTPPATDALTAVFGRGGAGLVLAVVMVVVVAPFLEELAFRGVIAGALGERYSLPVAVLGSAAVFSAYHLNAWIIVPTFVLGCALGWLALTRKTLWPAIVLHGLYNGVVVAAAFWLPGR